MSRALNSTCPSDEALACFASGDLDPQTRARVAAHLERCDECMSAVLAATAHLREENAERRPEHDRRWWIGAAAAAVIVVAVALPFALRRRDPMSRLVALAPMSRRVVEPRLSGGFGWAPYRGPMRSTAPDDDAARLKLGGAAGEAIERAGRDNGAAAQHAAGVAMVLVEKPDDAMVRLEAAALASHDAKTWSDLAAARYAAAVQLERASLYPLALAAADQALRIDPRLAEALFNRALILERMGLTGEARTAWLHYLEADPSSQWATEARQHVEDLPAATRSSGFEHDRPLLESAAAAGDGARVRELVDRYRQQSRKWAEAEYLGQWGEAVRRNDAAAASRLLTIARAIGGAIHELSGESMLRDDVASIDAASPAAQKAIAEGHLLYRQGRIEHSRQLAVQAERDLRLAAAHFDDGRSPMALMARYYAASARLARNDIAGGGTELERALTDAGKRPQYLALGAAVRWELARVHTLDGDSAGALPLLTDGAELCRRLGERADEAMLESMSAWALVALGRQDESWNARVRAFQSLSAEGDPEKLARSLLAAMDSELRLRQQDAALSLCAIAHSVEGSAARPMLVVETLTTKALLEATMQQPGEAEQTALQARQVAQQLPDEAMRARAFADIELATGAALQETYPRGAADTLTRAIDYYHVNGPRLALPEPLLLRARCAVRLRDAAGAARDLEEGMAAVEERRAADGGSSATGVLATERSLYRESIQLALDRNDPAAAFAYAERSRGGVITLAEMQRRLEASDLALLEVVVLRTELVTIAVTSRNVVVGRSALTAEKVEGLARASSGNDALGALAALHDAIVRPVDAVLTGARRIVFVADPELDGVPFAALFDRGAHRFLVERAAVAIAPNAASMARGDGARHASSVVAVGLPSGTSAETRNLPESDIEVADIARLYPHAVTIPRRDATWSAFTRATSGAAVVHIAGHTERQPGAGDAALLFAGASGGGVQRVSWNVIDAAPRIDAEVVVLAACETLRRPASANTRSLTLAGAFAAAGAHNVAGTLVPITDRDARELFRAFHTYLVSGDDAVDALRHTQLDALHAGTPHGLPAWAALAVLTTRIPGTAN